MSRHSKIGFAGLLMLSSISGTAQAQEVVTATNDQSCAGTRFGSDLNCTSNDFAAQVVFTQPSGGGLPSCAVGDVILVDVVFDIESNSPDRYDAGLFLGEAQNDPRLNDASAECSTAIFPTTAADNTDGYTDFDGDVCGDYIGGFVEQIRINQVEVECAPAPGTNLVGLPYVLSFDNQPGGATCTEANFRPGTKSKCVSEATAIIVGLEANGFMNITKQTTPGAVADVFDFTTAASPSATVTPSVFSLVDAQTQHIEVPLASDGTTRTLQVVELAETGWEEDVTISCTDQDGASAADFVTVDTATRTITAALTPLRYGVNCTVTNTRKTRVRTTLALAPGADPGLFDLSAGAGIAPDVGDGGSTGYVDVAAGASVGFDVTDGTGTTLSDYLVSWECTDDTDGGVVDSGTGTTTSFVPPAQNDTTCAFSALRILPGLALTKTATTGLVFDEIGDVIDYELVAENTGNVQLTGVTLSDPLLPTLSCAPAQPASLAPGATITCTGSYTTDAADGVAEQVVNLASVSGNGPNASSASDDDTVTVNYIPAILARDDAGSVTVTGSAGGTAVANVLVNDAVQGGQATFGNATVSEISSTNANVSLDTGDGSVDVAVDTPAGTYTLVYEACRTANPAQCDQATVTITVDAATLLANNDTGTVPSGAAGGTPVNVLANDTLDGVAVDSGEVSTTIDDADGLTGVSINGSGGLVVPAGTEAGTYAVVYTVCEDLNPTSCDTATATVTVGEASLFANNDLGTVSSGAAGGTAVNVLANDTLDGATPDSAFVTLTVLDLDGLTGATLSPAGALLVPAGTPAGTYDVVYRLCEDLNPTNCDEATASVTVGTAAIVANDDTGSVPSGAAGGTAANVLTNDTLDGASIDAADVTISLTDDDGLTGVAISAAGAVIVPAGTPEGTYDLGYSLCEDLNAGNCDTAVASITVAAAPIVANGDTGNVPSGAAGGTPVNVLVNDTLDGAVVDGSHVTITIQDADGLSGVSIAANGALGVPAGTAAGTYAVVYRICENLNATNCDAATATITVGEAVILATDDVGTVSSGAAGGTAVNVFGNDTLDGAAVVGSDVTATIQDPDGLVGLTLGAAGNLVFPSGTAAGNYVVGYRICEDLNPTNCDDAEVTVTVGEAAIVATNDAGTVPSGAAGGTAVNVFGNDTLDGAPVSPSDVTGTILATGGLTGVDLTASGDLTAPAGTVAGTYTVSYRICEDLNPSNCDEADVEVTVGAATIVAVDDVGSVSSGAAGGTAVNVLGNDTLDGTPVVASEVTISVQATGGLTGVAISPTGALDVPAGTSASTYTVTYRICEDLNPANCDEADVEVTVGTAAIVAVDDVGTVSSGAAGGTAVNVLGNDTLDGAPVVAADVLISVQATGGLAGATIDPTGALDVPAGTAAGTYTVTYRICEDLNPSNCDLADVEVTVGTAAIVAVDDVGTVPSGAAGGTATNVLTNDTLDGASVVAADVAITVQVTGGLTGVTIAPTGVLGVPAGTAAGTYTVTYRICEDLNPSNCDDADVEITVGTAVIVATDDSGSVTSGAAGGIAVDVLANDTLDGAFVDSGDVSTSIVDADGLTGVTIAADGDLFVPIGTPAGTYGVVYSLCEDLNPSNCDTAVATIDVGAAALVAVNDVGSVPSGAAGGTTSMEVLDNDTLDGAPVVDADVSTTVQDDGGLTGVSLSGAGAVVVPSGTAAGIYDVIYRVCEDLNPSNCDTARARIDVGAAVIVANDDTGSVLSGTSGGTLAGLFDNDTLDGAAVDPSAVTGSVFNTGGLSGVSVSAAGGLVVPAGTSAATYTVVYQLCEDLNPTNCDTATVSVTVGAGAVVLTDDAFTVSDGAVGGTTGDVTDNDLLDGNVVDASIWVLSITDADGLTGVSVGADGTLTVPAGTVAGTYDVVYRACEGLNPTNCDTATAVVTVGAASIVANDDTGSVGSGASGGVAVAVLSNDTLSGDPADAADVSLSVVADGGLTGVTLAASGDLTVPAGTEAGTYTVTYRLCEDLNPSNCDDADVEITVGTALIVATDDAGSVGAGAIGGTAVNVLNNDALDGAPVDSGDVTITLLDDGGIGVTVGPSGAAVVPAGTAAGQYTATYRICEDLNPSNCDEADVVIDVGAGTLAALDDVGTVASGAAGGSPVDVLANDILNGASVVPAEVTVTLLDDDGLTGVTIASDGTLVVPPGTPADTYAVRIEVCEDLNPSNCDTSIATITVGEAVIVANDDTGSVVSGNVGGTVTTLLDNDTLDGVSVDPADVTSSIDDDGGLTGATIADGTLTVPSGTSAGTYTVTYALCEDLNGTNCDTATVEITVGSGALVAQNDTGSVGSGRAGGTTTASALSNDTLDGVTVDGTVVTITVQDDGGLSGVSFTSAGGVVVPAGTASATYDVVYEICERLNPSNCDQATIRVDVGAAAIVANDTSGAVPSGNVGGTIPGLLDNDTLDGSPVDPADVSVSVSDDGGLTSVSIAPDGTLTIPAGTPEGTYPVTYELCERLNPTNCDTAVVSVEVGAGDLVANDDTLDVASGNVGGTTDPVLDNDRLDGAVIDPADVSLTLVGDGGSGATLAFDGTLTVPAGTAAGSYILTYEVCEDLNPTNCDTATVSLEVGAGVLVATNDALSVPSGSSGGTTASVATNDTLDGSPVDSADVTFSLTGDGGVTGATLGADGTIVVPSGTPAGSYTLTYEVCEDLNPTNCDTADITLDVGTGELLATDDAATIPSGSAGGTTALSVLDNDTLDGSPVDPDDVTVTLLGDGGLTGVSIAPDGTVFVPAGTTADGYTLTYEVCEDLNPTSCDTAEIVISVGAGDLVANDDIASVTSGRSGGVVPSAYDNDTLDGLPFAADDVTLSIIDDGSIGGLVAQADGSLAVPAGTPEDSYLVVYRICEDLNVSNCDEATYTIDVGAGLLTAVDDDVEVPNGRGGGTGGDICANDTIDGAPVTDGEVTTSLVSDGNLTNVAVDEDCGIVVPPGTPEGEYIIEVEVCEALNPSNCDTGEVTVTVGAPEIVANDDARVVGSGATGGTVSVLDNDVLDGEAASSGEVTVTVTNDGGLTGLTVDGDGGLVVPPGTPAAEYSVTYQVCEDLNPTNCDDATVVIDVGLGDVVAEDDQGSVVFGEPGNTVDTLGNDSLGGDPVDVSVVTVTVVDDGGITDIDVDGDGDLTVPETTPEGTYTVTVEVCETARPTNCDTAEVEITVVPREIMVVATPLCDNDTPWVDYVVTANFTMAQDPVDVRWIDSTDTEVASETGLPISGRLLWPGVVLDMGGNPIDWPGWVFGNGLWSEASDGFENTRPTATLEFSVNPTTEVFVNYPPAAPACIPGPPDNQPPIAEDDEGMTTWDLSIDIPVLDNDIDPEGGPLTVTIDEEPENGTVVVNDDGTVTYTADEDFVGEDTFTYTITDAAGNTDTATVTIVVEAVCIDGGADADDDGLTDCYELEIGTDPLNPNTDGDAFPDGFEDEVGLDPLTKDQTRGGGGGCNTGSSPVSGGLALLGLALLGLRRRRLGGIAAALLAVLGLMAPSVASAQDDRPTLDVQRFDPVTQFPGFSVVRDPEVLKAFRFDAVLSANYAYQPFELYNVDSNKRVAGLVDHMVGMDLGLGVAPTKWLHLALELPFLQTAFVDPDDADIAAALGATGRTVGIGDLRFAVNFRPVRQDDNGKISLLLTPYMVAPTGSRGLWAGSGVMAVGFDAAIGGHWKHFRFSLTSGFKFLANNNNAVAGVKADDEWNFGAGIGIPFLDQEELEVDLEWFGGAVVNKKQLELSGATLFGRGRVPMEVLLGLTWRPPEYPFWLKVGGGRGLTNGFGSPEARAFLQIGAFYQKIPVPDTDGDGYKDDVDECPEDPEDFDAFEDPDGCPEPDNDQDGILDVDDECPNDPEDKDGFEDVDGCPDPDNDQDTILDVDDDCPNDPEDMDGFKDEDGCPDPDNDLDKILDVDDECPNEPEVVNGVKDKDGCPDEALAVVEEDKKEIVILDRIYFDLGRATIQQRSMPVVDAVATILVEYPSIDQVEIQGHTDSRGSERTNQRLSDARAKSVVRALVERGIDRDRLTPIGYGESLPLVPDATLEEEHQANRRVQFLIQDAGENVEQAEVEAPDAVPVPD